MNCNSIYFSWISCCSTIILWRAQSFKNVCYIGEAEMIRNLTGTWLDKAYVYRPELPVLAQVYLSVVNVRKVEQRYECVQLVILSVRLHQFIEGQAVLEPEMG